MNKDTSFSRKLQEISLNQRLIFDYKNNKKELREIFCDFDSSLTKEELSDIAKITQKHHFISLTNELFFYDYNSSSPYSYHNLSKKNIHFYIDEFLKVHSLRDLLSGSSKTPSDNNRVLSYLLNLDEQYYHQYKNLYFEYYSSFIDIKNKNIYKELVLNYNEKNKLTDLFNNFNFSFSSPHPSDRNKTLLLERYFYTISILDSHKINYVSKLFNEKFLSRGAFNFLFRISIPHNKKHQFAGKLQNYFHSLENNLYNMNMTFTEILLKKHINLLKIQPYFFEELLAFFGPKDSNLLQYCIDSNIPEGATKDESFMVNQQTALKLFSQIEKDKITNTLQSVEQSVCQKKRI